MNADAVLVGGADESEETGPHLLLPEPEPRVPRARGGRGALLPAQEPLVADGRGPRLDAGAFVAGLEYAAGIEATVLGKPSPEYFGAALEAIDADPELTWMVGDDIEGDVVGAQQHGMRTVLVRTGKFRPDELEDSGVIPDGIVSLDRPAPRLARAEPLTVRRRRRPDRDRRASAARSSGTATASASAASRAASAPTATRSRIPPQHYAGRFAAKEAVGKALGSASTSPGRRSRSSAGRSPACTSPAARRARPSGSAPGGSSSR